MATLVDNYSESNYGSYIALYIGAKIASGQSFTASNSGNLTSCKFYLRKYGSPTGNAYAKLYSHSGTYGSTGTPNTLLATSGSFDVSTLTTSYALIIFTFSGSEQYCLTKNDKYFIVVESNLGNGSNHVRFASDSSSPSHSGNLAFYDTSWDYSGVDGIFYVYSEVTNVNVNDSISISENINIIRDLEININDSILITETDEQYNIFELNINDQISIIDNNRILPKELKVWINEIDRTKYISQTGFQIDNILTSQVDKCKFQIKKVNGSDRMDYNPTIGQDIQISYQYEKIFGGVITRVNKYLDTTGILVYDCECEDYTKFLDRKLVAGTYENQSVNDIINNINNTYLTDFTINNVNCDTIIDFIAFNYITVSKALAKLADLVHFDWYVDYNKDIHFFSKTDKSAPFDLLDTDGSYNINTLKIKQDNSQVRNSIYVRGGEYLADTFTTEIEADGTRNIYDIPYKYQDLSCTLSGQPLSVGLDYIDNENDYDVLWSYQEKLLKWKEADKPSVSAVIRVGGRPYLPVRLKTKNMVSIADMAALEGGDGEYEFIIIDDSIKSKQGALERANAELDNYKNTLIEGQFQTYNDGLRAGQKIRINSPLYDINEDYLINRVTIGMWTPTKLVYNVKIVSTKTYGLIEFLQDLLLRDNNKILDIGEQVTVIDLVADTSYETMTMADTMTVAFNHPQYETISFNETFTTQSLNFDTQFVLGPWNPINGIPINDNLIGWWKLDGSSPDTIVSDSSGNGNNGVLVSSPINWTTGKMGNGLQFIGSGSPKKTTGGYVQLDSLIYVTSNNHSISFWYKSSESYFQMLFQQSLNSSSSNIEFRPSDNTINVESCTNNFWDKSFATGIDIDDGEWHHYCFVFSNTNSKLYVDKVLADTQTENTDTEDFIYRLFGGYGNTDYTYGECPTGVMDEIRIWNNYTLTSNEVDELYNRYKRVFCLDGSRLS